MKRVYCLYRVSTLGQVEKDDIPMQRQACHAFAEKQGWQIIAEFSEKGVSGFKQSAEQREALVAIKQAAILKKFDVLLVFMFDRLGRRDDETPFVVEWFVKNGIAVWSVMEGEQRFENHVDKLLNYIRFWQSSGESIKTALRTRVRMEQLIQENGYVGGTAPYGYRLCKLGRVNKRGFEVHDLLMDPAKAEVIKTIFRLYCEEDMGPYRIAVHLTQQGELTRRGTQWNAASVRNILGNAIYGKLDYSTSLIDRVLNITVWDMTPEAYMEKLGFTDEEKEWASLLYSVLADDQSVSYDDTDGDGYYNTDYGDVTFEHQDTPVVYYNQTDARWGNKLYGKTGTIGAEGCGPTALAIVVATLVDSSVTPYDVAKWSAETGHRCEGNGSYHSLIPDGGAHYGLTVTGIGDNSTKLVEALQDGKLVIALMSKGHFTNGGHFIVLRGITEDGKILVADPASVKRSNQEWELGIVVNEARRGAAAGGPFWVFS